MDTSYIDTLIMLFDLTKNDSMMKIFVSQGLTLKHEICDTESLYVKQENALYNPTSLANYFVDISRHIYKMFLPYIWQLYSLYIKLYLDKHTKRDNTKLTKKNISVKHIDIDTIRYHNMYVKCLNTFVPNFVHDLEYITNDMIDSTQLEIERNGHYKFINNNQNCSINNSMDNSIDNNTPIKSNSELILCHACLTNIITTHEYIIK